MRGTEKPSTVVYWALTEHQILKSRNRPSLCPPGMYLWKEHWHQKGATLSPTPHSFINLDVTISWLASISEPYLPHLQNGTVKTCPAFSSGLSFGPNVSTGEKKKNSSAMSAQPLCEQGCHLWCENIWQVDKPHWLSINKIMHCFPHAAANFTKGSWLHCLWLKEILYSRCC